VFGYIKCKAADDEILLDAQLADVAAPADLDALAQEAVKQDPLSAIQLPNAEIVTRYVVNELLSTSGMKSSAFIIEKSFN
jgi:hypothetical protein